MAPTLTSRRRLFRLAPILAIALAAAVVPATAAAAADPPPPRLSQIRICDPTACYVAWHVVDSDGDGVSDADERAAGTNPYDANSFPPLTFVADLGLTRRLPSFENGLGAFVVFPAEIVNGMKRDPLGAFPLHTRADALTRMGIKSDVLKKFGISPDSSGFSIGLDSIGSKDNLPGLRVGGILASLISAGQDSATGGLEHGGIVRSGRNVLGNHVDVFKDGTWDEFHHKGGGTVSVQRFGADDQPAGSRTIDEGAPTTDDAGVTRSSRTVTNYDNDGNVLAVNSTEKHVFSDGSVSTFSVTMKPVRDEKGNVIGQIKQTTFSLVSGDGSYGMGVTQTETCDAKGENCTEEQTPADDEEYEDSDTVDSDGDGTPDWKQEAGIQAYTDPDADLFVISEELVEGRLRTRGAAITVVPNWSAPGLEETPEDPHNPTTVVLVDPEQQDTYMLVEPLRVTTPQPEGRPDLPNPGEGAPPVKPGCLYCH